MIDVDDDDVVSVDGWMDVGVNCRAEGGNHFDREGGGEQGDAVDGACHSSDACCA